MYSGGCDDEAANILPLLILGAPIFACGDESGEVSFRTTARKDAKRRRRHAGERDKPFHSLILCKYTTSSFEPVGAVNARCRRDKVEHYCGSSWGSRYKRQMTRMVDRDTGL